MTEAELQHLERQLGVTLPAEYRAAMLTYPFDAASPQAQWELPNNVIHLLELNRELRRDDELGFAWLDHWLAFGTTEDGDPYFFDTTQAAPAVKCADRIECRITDAAGCFSEWLAKRA